MEQYKRKDRSVSPETAKKISDSLKTYNATHPRPEIWKQRQSDGCKAYWKQIPPKQKEETTIQDIML